MTKAPFIPRLHWGVDGMYCDMPMAIAAEFNAIFVPLLASEAKGCLSHAMPATLESLMILLTGGFDD